MPLTALVVASSLGVAACSGQDGGLASGSPTTNGGGGSADNVRPGGKCTPEQVAALPAELDPKTCWSGENAVQPAIVDGRVFAVRATSDTESVLVAYDPKTGGELWSSATLPGEVQGTPHAVEIDGDPGVAVVYSASDTWTYAAWPTDVSPEATKEPADTVEVVDEQGSGSSSWSDQGLFIGMGDMYVDSLVLRPGESSFDTISTEGAPIVVDEPQETLDEWFVGISGDTVVTGVSGLAAHPDGTGASWYGLVGRGFDGTKKWEQVAKVDHEDLPVLYDGPYFYRTVIGDYLLSVQYDTGAVSWASAPTGAPATPSPDDLAGKTAQQLGERAAISPDGSHVMLWSSGADESWTVDVAANSVTPVDPISDIGMLPRAADTTNLYASGISADGPIVVDWASGKVTEPSGVSAMWALSDGYGAVEYAADGSALADTVLFAKAE